MGEPVSRTVQGPPLREPAGSACLIDNIIIVVSELDDKAWSPDALPPPLLPCYGGPYPNGRCSALSRYKGRCPYARSFRDFKLNSASGASESSRVQFAAAVPLSFTSRTGGVMRASSRASSSVPWKIERAPFVYIAWASRSGARLRLPRAKAER